MTVVCTLEEVEGKPKITTMDLEVSDKVAGVDAAGFESRPSSFALSRALCAGTLPFDSQRTWKEKQFASALGTLNLEKLIEASDRRQAVMVLYVSI